jgi:hypothetical protein
MNTNEASLGRGTVQTYSSRQKRAFDGVLFSMECTARWLENACDPMQAAAEIRLAMAELRNCIADCEVIPDAGSQPCAEKAAKAEPIYQTQMVGNAWADVSRDEYERTVKRFPQWARIIFIAPQQPAQSAEQDERAAWLEELNALVLEYGNAVLVEGGSSRIRHIKRIMDHARAASTQATTCGTCNGNGMIGGPSYYAPDEGGEPCPDCATATQPVKPQVALTLSLDQLAAVRAAANLAESMGSVVISTDLRSILTAAQSSSGGQA